MESSGMVEKLIIDTDIGDDIDDALALAFAVRRPEVEVKAVTTVYRRTDLRAAIAMKLLKVLGAEETPVAAGRSIPLKGAPGGDREKFLAAVPNQCPFVKEADGIQPPSKESAVELIIETVNEHKHDITLITIGAMTNAAAAIEKDPELPKKVKCIASMGGAPFENRVEHNIRCDADAARLVMNSGAKIFLAPIEPTCKIIMTPPSIEQMKSCRTPLTDALGELIDLWWSHRGKKPGPVIYDIAPILWSFNKTLFTCRPMRIDVETEGALTRAYTVPCPGEPNAEVCTDLDAEAILTMFMDTVCA